MLEKIQYKDIKRYKRYIPFDLNTKSKLYFDKDLIHKIPYMKERELDKILKYIDELKLEELIEIKKLIYRNGFIIGYSMKNYKEYKSLKKFKHRKFTLKKNDCFTLIESLKVLSQHNLSFLDCNLSNFLLNPKSNDIKICDIDGLTFIKNKSLNNEALKRILTLLLSYLYNVKECDIRNVLNSNGIDVEGSIINECCMLEKNISFETIVGIIDMVKTENIKKEKTYIVQKSKKLSESGYSKYKRF